MIPKAYSGTDRCIFVSYSHRNKPVVFELISRLQQRGFRIWYDGGLEPGDQWLDELAVKLEQCDCVIAMITNDFPTSKWCPRELMLADNMDKTLVPFYLEEVSLPAKLNLLLSGTHELRFQDFEGDAQELFDYICTLKVLLPYRDEPESPGVPSEETSVEEVLPQTDPWELPPSADPGDFLLGGGGRILTGYRGNGGYVVVPDGVRSIADNAFSNKTGIRALNLPEGLLEIGAAAFSGCTNLEGILLPESLQRLGNGAFSNCTALKTVKLPDKLQVLPWFTFQGCTALESVTLPQGITAIGAQCFGDCCALTGIDLPDALLRLDRDAFSGCFALETVTGPVSRNLKAFVGTPYYESLKQG